MAVFENCPRLTSIIFNGNNPPELEYGLLESLSDITSIYVPDEAVDAYKEAVGTTYANLIKPISTMPTEPSDEE